ncbi:glucosaminidase domain-containing protein [Congregibacter litoralis]|uniref:Putative FlgJ-related protein n=1 Tax=Congregibacter litoralis KT71 TaxID=314285 RepID=A4A4X7_9GAMM|nr:glucosaminidase domain-containing protein [Congregibacter litoralis]EAQ98848.1 putative FlgJ-related protein [Congregibacter litoralis KT71]
MTSSCFPQKTLILAAFCILFTACGGHRDKLPDLAAIDDVSRMKATFYDYLAPIVMEQNTRILKQRADLGEIRAMLEAGDSPGWFQRRSLKALAQEYEVEWDRDEPGAVADRLWRRVDVIPEDLALAQAAKESGWGRSRFAVEVNNLFGHWCYQPGCGVVPARRTASGTHEVAAFDSVSESVRRYMNNLNTHERYAPMRRLRLQRRSSDKPITGAALAPGLEAYSQRGAPYVQELLSMMSQNQALLDEATAG